MTSMQALGFDNYAGVMKVYLSKFRVVSKSDWTKLTAASGDTGAKGTRRFTGGW